ncbi:hypothetical protein QUF31_21645 [Dickeya chrysanthemi]|uniref:hypothetical protein n=1 Tax=Dickeya chrysanthemi TaxID=556 RepID=UPI00259FF40D|nr:hypothetical protein [Dickeya chrysanthemi]WJM85541.1 hypothetical protein QUF31_21645 [Dickeya chrysanthemi]
MPISGEPILSPKPNARAPPSVAARKVVAASSAVASLATALARMAAVRFSLNMLLSQQLGVPLLAKFRAQYEPAAVSPPPPPPPPARAEPAAPVVRPAPGRMQRNAVRSGQQLYAENCDLTVLSTVGAGAEVIGLRWCACRQRDTGRPSDA